MGSPEFTVRVPDGSSRTEIETDLPNPSFAGPSKAMTDKARPAANREVSLGIDDFWLQAATGHGNVRPEL